MNEKEVMVEVLEEIKKKKLPPLLDRLFVDVCCMGNAEAVDGDGTFRIMQWNILAQALSRGSDNFILCPKEALDWENRCLRIIEELLRYNPSILCLEEVDHYNYIKGMLVKVGYQGIFFPKPDSPCLYAQNSSGPDGCAVFFKTSDFVLLESNFVILLDSVGVETNQVAVIVKFGIESSSLTGTGPIDGAKNVPSQNKKEFYVACTHLKAKAGYEVIRFEQGQFLIDYLSKLTGTTPILICGDFNAVPTEQVYEVFSNSKLNLDSAYTNLSDTKQEPRYTTWKIRGSFEENRESCKTIDYIWHSRSKIVIRKILSLPTDADIGENRLPSFTYPSDHLSLVCDISLKFD